MNEHGDCVKCASGQPFDHGEAQEELSPAFRYLKGMLSTLLQNLKNSGFAQEAAHQLAEGLLKETMQIDTQVQAGTCTKQEALQRAEALYNCAREARPTATLAQAAAGLSISTGVGWARCRLG